LRERCPWGNHLGDCHYKEQGSEATHRCHLSSVHSVDVHRFAMANVSTNCVPLLVTGIVRFSLMTVTCVDPVFFIPDRPTSACLGVTAEQFDCHYETILHPVQIQLKSKDLLKSKFAPAAKTDAGPRPNS
jgi:hypothetical protein